MRARCPRLVATALLAGMALLTLPVHAFVPPARRVAAAVAKANHAARRDQLLRCNIALFSGDGAEPEAIGELWTAPDGRARLELRGADGRLRELRVGARVEATLDGRPLQRPPFELPPLALLQAALVGLGGSAGAIELGYDGPIDAYVLGGRGATALWVDVETVLPVRIDLTGDTTVRLGPVREQGSILWPTSLSIQRGEGLTLRLEFRSVRSEQSGSPLFERSWLQAGRTAGGPRPESPGER